MVSVCEARHTINKTMKEQQEDENGSPEEKKRKVVAAAPPFLKERVHFGQLSPQVEVKCD